MRARRLFQEACMDARTTETTQSSRLHRKSRPAYSLQACQWAAHSRAPAPAENSSGAALVDTRRDRAYIAVRDNGCAILSDLQGNLLARSILIYNRMSPARDSLQGCQTEGLLIRRIHKHVRSGVDFGELHLAVRATDGEDAAFLQPCGLSRTFTRRTGRDASSKFRRFRLRRAAARGEAVRTAVLQVRDKIHIGKRSAPLSP